MARPGPSTVACKNASQAAPPNLSSKVRTRAALTGLGNSYLLTVSGLFHSPLPSRPTRLGPREGTSGCRDARHSHAWVWVVISKV